MTRLNTLRELFHHFDWASARVRAAAAALPDDKLDGACEMGLGSLRKTLWHIHTAEEAWLRRVAGEPVRFAPDRDRGSLPILEESMSQTRELRQRLIDPLTDEELDGEIKYADGKGNPRSAKLGHILLHVCNHAMHHHAQSLNMLRRARVKPPRVDYLFRYYENPDLPAPALSVGQVRDYFRYTDWGRDQVMKLLEEMDDAALDRPFEMGMGSLRKTLLHLHAAEEFWLRNWLGPHDHPFGKADEPLPLKQIRVRFDETAAQRNELLLKKSDADLTEPVAARLPDGRTLKFPLGVTAMQLCGHGTHHRAQVINMLRHCGKPCPATDYTVMQRQIPVN